MAVRIEDAGFEIRDLIAWVYGSGFPKSLNVSKALDAAAGATCEVLGVAGKSGSVRNSMAGDFAGGEYMATAPATAAAAEWDGWGTALKPALEPITMARKPFATTVAANVLVYGTGALNIDASRVVTTDALGGGDYAAVGGRTESASLHGGSGMNVAGKTAGTEFVQPTGRWPSNLIHDGSDEVLAAFPTAPGQMARARTDGEAQGNAVFGALRHVTALPESARGSGSAARFFYCAKASKADRGEGNTHPTVKPTDLMRYLVTLVTPPGGVTLDPWMGSGSTGKAAVPAGFRFIGIDRDDWLDLAVQRITRAAYGSAAA